MFLSQTKGYVAVQSAVGVPFRTALSVFLTSAHMSNNERLPIHGQAYPARRIQCRRIPFHLRASESAHLSALPT